MLKWKIYPLFITGPNIKDSSDRRKMFSFFSKKGFRYIFPENVQKLIENEKSIYSKIAKYCFKNSNAFETVLSSISLRNLMFPHTSSSAYELGQFKMRWSKQKTLVFEPKTKSSNDEKNHLKFEIGEYITMSHEGEMTKYDNNVNESGFPEINLNWLSKYVNFFSKKLKKETVNLNVRIFKKTSIVKRNNFIHFIFLNSDLVNEEKLYIPSKIFYIFLCQYIQNFKAIDFFDNYYQIYEQTIKAIGEYYNVQVDKIELIYSASRVSLKQVILSMLLICKMSKPKIKIPKLNLWRNSRVFHKFSIGKREVTTYAKTFNGDIRKNKDKIISIKNRDAIQKCQSNYSFAYRKEVNWIDNVGLHIHNIYGSNKKFFILKIDIQESRRH